MPNLQRQQQQQDRTRHPVRHLRGPPDANAEQMEQEAMTPTQRAAMEQALEALRLNQAARPFAYRKAITALRAALAEQPAEQAPVAVAWIPKAKQMPPPGQRVFWMDTDTNMVGYDTWAGEDFLWMPTHWMPIPPAPQQEGETK